MGDRARRLQRVGRRLELLYPRPGPLACLSVGRRWHRWILGRQAAALFRAGALERDTIPFSRRDSFGLTNSEGNHGEDVKEYYFYLDCTPTNSYMKYLYKYPQWAFPYLDLVTTNRQRNRYQLEYELLDTGIFNEDTIFRCFVEYAKDSPEDFFIKITVSIGAIDAAAIHVLPTLWFRNTWSSAENAQRPQLKRTDAPGGIAAIVASEPALGEFILYAEDDPELLFTENETNNQTRLREAKTRHPTLRTPSIPTS